MTRKDFELIAEVIVPAVTKAVMKNLSVYVRRIVREELEIQGSLIQEQVEERPVKKQARKRVSAADSQLFGDTFRDIVESSKQKVKMPTTGNRMLDEIIETTPTEDQLINRQRVVIPKSEPINIEELYLNGIKAVKPEVAENIDYSAFLEKMDEIKGTPPPSNAPRGIFKVDKSDILQEQRVGPTRIEKTYKA